MVATKKENAAGQVSRVVLRGVVAGISLLMLPSCSKETKTPSVPDQNSLYAEFVELPLSIASDQSLTSVQRQAKLDELQRKEMLITAKNTDVKNWACTVNDIVFETFNGETAPNVLPDDLAHSITPSPG